MNKAEYNRKMKALDRDIDRANVAIHTAADQGEELWRKADELRDGGWTE